MDFEEHKNYYKSNVPFIPYSHADELRAEEERCAMRDAAADAKAVWALADMMIPVDVKEMAERWNMKETILEMWRNAFIAGWRASHRSEDVR